MATDILIADGTAIVIADTTDYAGDLGTRTDQILLEALTNTSARQSAKIDLGAARADRFAVFAALEFQVAPVSLTVVEFYWGPSPSTTAGTANPGGLTGADAAYTGTASDSLLDSLSQLLHIGNLVCTADATTVVQFQRIGTIHGAMRYGSLVVHNLSGQSLLTADAVEMGVALYPLKAQSQ